MNDILKQLKDHFENTPRDIIEEEWKEFDSYNNVEFDGVNSDNSVIRDGWADKFDIYSKEEEDELMIPDFVDYESENLL